MKFILYIFSPLFFENCSLICYVNIFFHILVCDKESRVSGYNIYYKTESDKNVRRAIEEKVSFFETKKFSLRSPIS